MCDGTLFRRPYGRLAARNSMAAFGAPASGLALQMQNDRFSPYSTPSRGRGRGRGRGATLVNNPVPPSTSAPTNGSSTPDEYSFTFIKNTGEDLYTRLQKCRVNGTFNYYEAGKCFTQSLDKPNCEQIISAFCSENFSRIETFTMTGYMEDVRRAGFTTAFTIFDRYLMLGKHIKDSLMWAQLESIQAVANAAITQNTCGNAIFEAGVVEDGRFVLPDLPPFKPIVLTTSGWKHSGEVPHIQLTSLFRHILKQACDPPTAIKGYTYRSGSGRANFELQQIPEPIFITLREFSNAVFSINRPELVDPEETVYETEYFRKLGSDHTTRLRVLRQQRELRHKWITIEVPKQLTTALIALRKAKYIDGRWVMDPKKGYFASLEHQNIVESCPLPVEQTNGGEDSSVSLNSIRTSDYLMALLAQNPGDPPENQ
ncbi:unnamed protein product [Caenorhabditis auriculariae]|uniref:Uncharacterized protein n=1 Tax=Caenorhabditis auriculariae TaxID=2777116 RepID=A0A8S1GSE6_9PELO|nr:unnamed protein product [Caenorhabditis auriculariae]